MKKIISSARERFEVRRAAKREWQLLERDVAGFSSESDLRDLEAILDRHREEDTAAIRRIISLQRT